MSKIQINYSQVYSEVPKLKNHVTCNIVDYTNGEYQKIQSLLSDYVDGETNAYLKEVMEANREKTLEAAYILEELLQFISDSSKQMEINEHRLARTMTADRK